MEANTGLYLFHYVCIYSEKISLQQYRGQFRVWTCAPVDSGANLDLIVNFWTISHWYDTYKESALFYRLIFYLYSIIIHMYESHQFTSVYRRSQLWQYKIHAQNIRWANEFLSSVGLAARFMVIFFENRLIENSVQSLDVECADDVSAAMPCYVMRCHFLSFINPNW